MGALTIDRPIEQRLGFVFAALGLLRFDRAAFAAMPERARSMFEEIERVMSAHRAGGETAPPTVELAGSEADKLAEKIASLYVELNDGT